MFDDIAQQIVDWLTSRTADDYRRYAFLLLSTWVAYRLLRWLIRRFTPWLLRWVLFPLVAAATVVGCVVALTAQTLLALPFRAMRMRPPGLVFSAGDVATGATRQIVGAGPLLGLRIGFLAQVPRIVILVILVTLGWWGHEVVCREDPGSQWCVSPVAAANAVGDDLWDWTVTAAQDVFARGSASAAGPPAPRSTG